MHTVVRQVSKDIPVYELRPEKGKGRSRTLQRNPLLPCDHLPLETQVRRQAKKRTVVTTEEVEQSEGEEDDDECYPVLLHQLSQSCQPQTANPEPAEHIQLEENMSPESGREHGVMTQPEHSPDQVDLPVEEAVPSLEPSEHSRTSEQEPQRRPKVFTYDQLGTPACYNLRTLPHHTDFKVPWTHVVQQYYYEQPYGYGW